MCITAPDLGDHLLGQRQIGHERGAGTTLEDLVRRAAHVDVADVGSESLDDLGGPSHGLDIGTVDLDGQGALLWAEVHEVANLGVSPDDGARRDELHGHDPDATDPPHDQAKIPIGDTRHGRQEQGRLDANGAEGQHGMAILTALVDCNAPNGSWMSESSGSGSRRADSRHSGTMSRRRNAETGHEGRSGTNRLGVTVH